MNKKFIPVMLTPFKENGDVDYDGLTELTEYYIKAGAKGLFANCLSSEMFELTEAERLKVVKHVVKTVNGTVPVVATGTFEGSLNKQAEFIKRTHDLGVGAVIIITGIMAGEQEDDAIFHLRILKLFALTGNIPLGFYECPVPYKRIVTPSRLKLLVETGRISYYKDTCLDINLVKAKIDACYGHDFKLYDAYMVNAINSLEAGAAGLSCIQGNYFPDMISWLCHNYIDKKQSNTVKKVMAFLIENMKVMHDVYPASAKYCLQKQGLNISTITRNKKNLTTSGRSDIDKLHSNYLLLKEELQ